jgi:PEP-CTERM motif
MTTRIPRFLKAVLIPGLLATWLFAANHASAATITDWTSPDPSALDDGATDPQSDLSGWFLTFDPSDEWTSAANIATLEAWLAIAEDISDNPLTNSTPPLTGALSSSVAVVPEPATLGLLGIALAILLFYVPIRKPHRSVRN